MHVIAVPRPTYPARRRRRSRVLLAMVMAVSLLPGVLPGEALGARPFRMNLGEQKDFVPQTNFVQCVGASIQMMLNIMEPGADRSAATQGQIQDLARAWSGPRPDGTTRKGASVRGWAAGLVIRGGGPYRIVGVDSLQEAMQVAALAIRRYHRPVGLLMWQGRHAWVMSGFEATADPASGDAFTVTKAMILDPLHPHGSKAWGASPRPGAATSVSVVGRQFVQRRTGGPWNALPGTAHLAGKYVLVIPVGPVRPGMD